MPFPAAAIRMRKSFFYPDAEREELADLPSRAS